MRVSRQRYPCHCTVGQRRYEEGGCLAHPCCSTSCEMSLQMAAPAVIIIMVQSTKPVRAAHPRAPASAAAAAAPVACPTSRAKRGGSQLRASEMPCSTQTGRDAEEAVGQAWEGIRWALTARLLCLRRAIKRTARKHANTAPNQLTSQPANNRNRDVAYELYTSRPRGPSSLHVYPHKAQRHATGHCLQSARVHAACRTFITTQAAEMQHGHSAWLCMLW